MQKEYSLNIPEVHQAAERLSAAIDEQISEMNKEYASIQAELAEMDGATNAFFRGVMEQNKQKELMVEETLEMLIQFIMTAADILEANDNMTAAAFNRLERRVGG